jgi:hypothetical protein
MIDFIVLSLFKIGDDLRGMSFAKQPSITARAAGCYFNEDKH